MSLADHVRGLPLRALVTVALLFLSPISDAGPLRDLIKEHRAAQQADVIDEAEPSAGGPVPNGVRVVRNVAYGKDVRQRMDVYLPHQAAGAPVIFMVHGGAWRMGDKDARTVVDNKVARWVPRGFIFISADYRLLPKAAPLKQAEDVAKALATAQRMATSWGGDPAKFILMGHSAGAHLAALLAASPAAAQKAGVKPWLGTVVLDSAAFDVVAIMEAKHARFYDRAFGTDPAYWHAASPIRALSGRVSPILAVCSAQRDDSCPQARRFAAKVVSLGARADVLEQDLSHREINQKLGIESEYTAAVESFMATLDEGVARALAKQPH
jgi:acetyl esterase/lipase